MKVTVHSKPFNTPLSRFYVVESVGGVNHQTRKNFRSVSQNESVTSRARKRYINFISPNENRRDPRRFIAHVASECSNAFDITEWSSESEEVLFRKISGEAIDIDIWHSFRRNGN